MKIAISQEREKQCQTEKMFRIEKIGDIKNGNGEYIVKVERQRMCYRPLITRVDFLEETGGLAHVYDLNKLQIFKRLSERGETGFNPG